MASKVLLKKSSVATKAPVAGDLDYGELAINYTDGKLYFKKADNSIDYFATGAASAPVTSVGGFTGAVTAANLMTAIQTVDGAGSGLDADTLDGNHASSFYLASNPSGYTNNTGTVTSVGATAPVVSSGGTAPTISMAAATASVNGYMTSTYASKLDGIAAGATNVTNNNQLTNGAGYITGITSANVTTALGYTPYNSTNPSGYITSTGSITGSAGSVTGLTLTSSANGIDPDNVTQNQLGYNTTVSLFGQTDGGLYSSAYSSSWIHQIYGDFRTGQIAIRGKNSGTWQAWRTVLDSSNYNSYISRISDAGGSGAYLSLSSGNELEFFNSAGAIQTIYINYSSTDLASVRGPQGHIMLHAGNYNSYSPSLTGTGASGTWGISVTGNAATATNSTQLGGLTKAQLWNNGGQTHGSYNSFSGPTTFGEWFIHQDSGVTDGPSAGSVGGSGTAQYYSRSVGLGSEYEYSNYAMQQAIARNVTQPYHWVRSREGTTWQAWTKVAAGYADSTPWSGVTSKPTTLAGYGITDGMSTSGNTTGYAKYLQGAPAYTNGTDGWWRSDGQAGWYNSTYGVGIYATEAGNVRTYNGANFIAAGSITANSDERLKTNWRDLPIDFIERLAKVKYGTYDRVDDSASKTQDGVSAQSLRPLLPNSVLEDSNGILSVNYGGAALVSAVALAERVVQQDKRIAELERLIAKIIGD